MEALLEGLTVEAAKRGEVDLFRVSMDSTTARVHHDTVGMHLGQKDQAANRKKIGCKGGRPVSHDADFYKERNTVERLINKLKAWRDTATRYDKIHESYLASLHLRASMIWIKDLTRTTH